MIRYTIRTTILTGLCLTLWTVTTAKAQEPPVSSVIDTLHFDLSQAIEVALSENPTIVVAGQEIERKQYARRAAIGQLLPQVAGQAGYTRTIKKQVMYMGGGDGDGGGFASMMLAPVVGLTKPLYDKLGIPMPDISAGQQQQQQGDGGIEVGLANNWSAGLSLSLPVFAPTLYKAIQLTDIDIQLAVEQARASRNDMVNQVSKAYYQLLLAQDSYGVLQQSYAQAEANLANVRRMFEQGLVSDYDRIRAEVQVRNITPNLIQMRNAVEISKLQLKTLMGLDAELPIAIEGRLSDYETKLYGDYMEVDTAQLAQNSNLRQLDLQASMLRKTYDMNRAAFLPNISISAVYQWTSMNEDFKIRNYRWNPYSSVGISLAIPIFTGGQRTSQMKQTRLQMSQLQHNRIHLRRNLNMQARNYLNSMQQSIEQLASNKENINQAVKGRDIARKRYDVGMGTILELNDSELALTQSRLTYAQAVYNYLAAKADLDLVMGKENDTKQ